MKKIPTLFKREFKDHKIVNVLNEVTPGMEWVLAGEGTATIKIDGSCCAIIDGVLYKRYDAKAGKSAPADAIPCCDPDPVTGHWPHWVPVDITNPADMWFVDAFKNTFAEYMYADNHLWANVEDATYEAIGVQFQGNPYNMPDNYMVKHGAEIISDCPRDFDGIRDYLEQHAFEGIVFWKDGSPQCKIKRSDFGFKWPVVIWEDNGLSCNV